MLYETSRSLTNFNKSSSIDVDASPSISSPNSTNGVNGLSDAKLLKEDVNKDAIQANKKLLTVRENTEFRNSMPPVSTIY